MPLAQYDHAVEELSAASAETAKKFIATMPSR
jgi:hypothetical protein